VSILDDGIWLVAAQSPALAIIQAKGSHEHAVVSFFEFAYKWGCNTRTSHVTGQNSWQPHLERGLWDRGRLARSFFREAKLKTRAGRPRSQDPTSPAMTPSGAASRFAPVAVALIFQISPDQEFPRWNEFPGYHPGRRGEPNEQKHKVCFSRRRHPISIRNQLGSRRPYAMATSSCMRDGRDCP